MQYNESKKLSWLSVVFAISLAGCGGGGGGGGGDDDSDESPARIALSNISVSDSQPTDGGYAIGTLFVGNGGVDISEYTLTIAGGADEASFSIDQDQLKISAGVLQAANQSQYEVTVRATRSGSSISEQDFTILVVESEPLTIGYYDTVQNTGQVAQETPILAIGETPEDVGDIGAADFAGMDILFFQNPSSSPPFGAFVEQANIDKVDSFVLDGGVLVFHDRYPGGTDDVIPGNPGDLILDSSAGNQQFSVLDNLTILAQGPAGTIDGDNIEGGSALSFGYADASTVPADAIGLLSREDTDRWVTYAYPYGNGYVIYSSIPLDFYLANGNPESMRDLYAPNILAQARALLKKAPDDDGDGLSNAEEALLGTEPGMEDTDGDGLTDRYEIRNGFDATKDGDDVADTDGDGLTNLEEVTAGTLPRNEDSDGDGLSDGDEVNTHGSNPLLIDSDSDGLTDGDEVATYLTNPAEADSDTGGTDDGREVLINGTDPNDVTDDVPAVAIPLNLNDTNGFLWDIREDGRMSNGTSDAYDGGMRLRIDAQGFPNFDEASELQGGREVELGIATMSDLLVSRRIYVPSDQAFARYLEILRNPTDTDIDIELEILTNLGSDGGTVIVSTSDGDATIEAGDSYVVTDDAGDGSGDPSLAHVVGRAPGLLPTISAPIGNINYSYNITVPANDRMIVMHFDSQNANRAAAIASAQSLVLLTDGALEGLSTEELDDIINF